MKFVGPWTVHGLTDWQKCKKKHGQTVLNSTPLLHLSPETRVKKKKKNKTKRKSKTQTLEPNTHLMSLCIILVQLIIDEK